MSYNSYKLDRIRILIVEDNQPMVDLLRSVLFTFGVTNIDAAENGRDGFRKFATGNHDLIIADWMMEPVDGITFAHQVRTDPKSANKYVPIILMTGFGQRHRVEQARDSGVTEFLVKPFNARDLYKRIVQVIERPRQFVRADEFFGPDRRRKDDSGYDGPERRADKSDTFFI